MKKLTLSVLIASAMSLPAMAGDHDHKISTQFSALDSDGNGVLDKEELKDSPRIQLRSATLVNIKQPMPFL